MQQGVTHFWRVSVKQIANIEKGKMNPSYLILRALAKVLHISLDTLINPDISHFPFFDIGDLLYRNMAQIRKFLLCQLFILSGFPPFIRHNKVIPLYKPERYNILEVNDYAD